MGKRITVILNVLSLALVGGAYAVHYFAAHRIGMVRWVNFHTQNIRAVIPIDVVKYVVLLGVILAVAVLAWRILRSPQHSVHDARAVAFAVCITLAYAAVVFFVTHDVSRADVFVVGMVGLAALLQVASLLHVLHQKPVE